MGILEGGILGLPYHKLYGSYLPTILADVYVFFSPVGFLYRNNSSHMDVTPHGIRMDPPHPTAFGPPASLLLLVHLQHLKKFRGGRCGVVGRYGFPRVGRFIYSFGNL